MVFSKWSCMTRTISTIVIFVSFRATFRVLSIMGSERRRIVLRLGLIIMRSRRRCDVLLLGLVHAILLTKTRLFPAFMFDIPMTTQLVVVALSIQASRFILLIRQIITVLSIIFLGIRIRRRGLILLRIIAIVLTKRRVLIAAMLVLRAALSARMIQWAWMGTSTWKFRSARVGYRASTATDITLWDLSQLRTRLLIAGRPTHLPSCLQLICSFKT